MYNFIVGAGRAVGGDEEVVFRLLCGWLRLRATWSKFRGLIGYPTARKGLSIRSQVPVVKSPFAKNYRGSQTDIVPSWYNKILVFLLR